MYNGTVGCNWPIASGPAAGETEIFDPPCPEEFGTTDLQKTKCMLENKMYNIKQKCIMIRRVPKSLEQRACRGKDIKKDMLRMRLGIGCLLKRDFPKD